MATNWQCKCGEITYSSGEPSFCMQCRNEGEWSIYVPTETEIAEQSKIDAEWDDDSAALHENRTSTHSSSEALGGEIGGKTGSFSRRPHNPNSVRWSND